MTLPQTVHIGTDVAGLAIFHPDDFPHRWESDILWYHDNFAVEAAAARIVCWSTGSDGFWAIRLTDRSGELPLVEGHSTDFLLVVRHGRVLVDNTSFLPSTEVEPETLDQLADDDYTVIPNGRYRVTVSLVDRYIDDLPDYEVLFTPIDESVDVTPLSEPPDLRPSPSTLGRVVTSWVAHPHDPRVSAYERYLIALDSGDPVALLPEGKTDGTPAAPPTPPPRTSAPPTAAASVIEVQRLIVDAIDREALGANRLDRMLASRILTYPGLASWLLMHLPLSDREREALRDQTRQRRLDALLDRLQTLVEVRPDQTSTLSPEEARLTRTDLALEVAELPDPALIFADPAEGTLPGATLQLAVPAEYADQAAAVEFIGLTGTERIAPGPAPRGYLGAIAAVHDWDRLTGILTVEAVALGACSERPADDGRVVQGRIHPAVPHKTPKIGCDLVALLSLITVAEERDSRLAGGPDRVTMLKTLAQLSTAEGVAEWLLRALPMRPDRRLQIYSAKPDIAGAELLAQLEHLAHPEKPSAAESDLLAERPWLTSVPPGPLHITTGEALLPGQRTAQQRKEPGPPRYDLVSPAGYDGDFATLTEVEATPVPGWSGVYEHHRYALGIVRINRTHIAEDGLTGVIEPALRPTHESVEDLAEPAAVAAYVNGQYHSGTRLDPQAVWDVDRWHSARAASAWLLCYLPMDPKIRLTLVVTPARERLHVLLDQLESFPTLGERIPRSETLDSYPAYEAMLASQPAPGRSEVPIAPVPLLVGEDVNLAVGDTTNLEIEAEKWPEISGRRYVAYGGAGAVGEGAPALLLRATTTKPEIRQIGYAIIGSVCLGPLSVGTCDTAQAMVVEVGGEPSPPPDGIDRVEVRKLLFHYAAAAPEVASGWQRPAMRPINEVADLSLSDLAADLLRRLPMPTAERIKLAGWPDQAQLTALLDLLRTAAGTTPPTAQRAQRLDRPTVDLPREGVPVLATSAWLKPGAISTVKASAFICRTSLAAGWLAITTEVGVGQVVLVTRPLSASPGADANGWYDLTLDQLRPAVVRDIVPGEQGRSLVIVDPAPSADESVGVAWFASARAHELLTSYLALLDRGLPHDNRLLGPLNDWGYRLWPGGPLYRRWEAGLFTSLGALLSQQIGQLPFNAQTVLTLQAVAWPDRLQALTAVLEAVAAGRSLSTGVSEATALATRALAQALAESPDSGR